jgi:starvation-inducible DNA-binding protein
MGLDQRPDTKRSPVPSGIPGARPQPELGQWGLKPKVSALAGPRRPRRRAARSSNCELLNALLADSMILYAHYTKYLWLVRDQNFYQLRFLFDRSASEQSELIDILVQRVQALRGVPTLPSQVGDLTLLSRPPKDAEEMPEMLLRLSQAHQLIIGRVRDAIRETGSNGDDRTEDLLNHVLHRHESQVRLLADYLDEATEESA